MGDHHTPVTVEPETIARAEQGWNAFTQFTKYGVLGVIAILALMALTLL